MTDSRNGLHAAWDNDHAFSDKRAACYVGPHIFPVINPGGVVGQLGFGDVRFVLKGSDAAFADDEMRFPFRNFLEGFEQFQGQYGAAGTADAYCQAFWGYGSYFFPEA